MSFFAKHPASRVATTQTIAYNASVAIANPFGPETYQLRLVANSACCYRIGDGPQTATVADVFLPANTIDYVTVNPGQSISAIAAATNGLVTTMAGTLWITETS
jgi:hypothetical protein